MKSIITLAFICSVSLAAEAATKLVGGVRILENTQPIDVGQPISPIRQAKAIFRIFRTTVTQTGDSFFFKKDKACELQGPINVYDLRQVAAGFTTPSFHQCITTFQGQNIEIDVGATVILANGGMDFPGEIKAVYSYSNLNMQSGGNLPPIPVGAMSATRDLHQRSFMMLMDADPGIYCEGQANGQSTCSVRNPEFFSVALEVED